MKPYHPLSIAELSSLMIGEDENLRWRLTAEFLKDYKHEPIEIRSELTVLEPGPTGDERWDVFLAALAEFVGTRDPGWLMPDVGGTSTQVIPAWTAGRSLAEPWFIHKHLQRRPDLAALSPPPFQRRNIFLYPEDLGVA